MNLGFLQLLGDTDMGIKEGLLYADHIGNLVALSVSDFGSIEEKGRLPSGTGTRVNLRLPDFILNAPMLKGTRRKLEES